MKDDKTCLVLLIVQSARVARRHASALGAAGFDVRRVRGWTGDRLDYDPEVVVVELPPGRPASDVATRLRAQARFAPLIILGLSSSADFENDRRAGRHSGFDDVLPVDVDAGCLLSRVQQLLLTRPPLTPCVTSTNPVA